MPRTHKSIVLVLAVAIAAVWLSGCGQHADGGVSQLTPTPTVEVSPLDPRGPARAAQSAADAANAAVQDEQSALDDANTP